MYELKVSIKEWELLKKFKGAGTKVPLKTVYYTQKSSKGEDDQKVGSLVTGRLKGGSSLRTTYL